MIALQITCARLAVPWHKFEGRLASTDLAVLDDVCICTICTISGNHAAKQVRAGFCSRTNDMEQLHSKTVNPVS